MVQSATLLECSNNVESFYWTSANSDLYVHMQNHDSPYLHTINIGVVSGYSREGFTPVNSNVFYESRLLSVPSITKSRDPLFWGKIQFEGGAVDLNNGDGHLDLTGETFNVYGNQARVSIGFADQDISEYVRLFTGFVETLKIDERGMNITFKDRRKSLTKKILYSCTNLNALEAIEEILLDNYGIPYNGLYYNMTKWEADRAIANNVTINMQKEDEAIKVIQSICESTFGMFGVDPDGKYTFRIVRSTDTSDFTIMGDDILNYVTATYDPSQVITSTLIGYAKNWTTTGTAYTYLNDTTQEEAIYQKYKVYNERTFDTYLPTLAQAQDFSDNILSYAGSINPIMDIEVPIKYYLIDVGDFADVTINRPNAVWLGTNKCEVIGKIFNLDRNTISFKIKKYTA
jgi:hypothetical protein